MISSVGSLTAIFDRNVTVPYQRTPKGVLQPQLLMSEFGFSASSNLTNSGVSYVLGGIHTWD